MNIAFVLRLINDLLDINITVLDSDNFFASLIRNIKIPERSV